MAQRFSRIDALRAALVAVLSSGTWETIKNTFRRVDLQWREDLGPGSGKPRYVDRVLQEMSEPELLSLAKRTIERMDSDAAIRSVEDALWWIEDGTQKISDVTRGELADAFDGRILSPRETFEEFVERHSSHSGGYALSPPFSSRFEYRDGKLCRIDTDLIGAFSSKKPTYVLSNHREALGKAGFFAWPDRRIKKFLEALVEPRVRIGPEQQEWVTLLNHRLAPDGFRLEEFAQISGHGVFHVAFISKIAHGRPKNLIFASHQQGFKPILGLSDALDNDIVALQNEDTCLIYDESIPDEGLTWENLIDWWTRSRGIQDSAFARTDLGERLRKALGSKVEQVLFAEYFKSMKPRYGNTLPALLPQVYVHYDPRTRAAREGGRHFVVQRMDFLLLLQGRVRAIIEIDGKQHYSTERALTAHDILNSRDKHAIGVRAILPSPEVYADTVRADRELRLQGYEVYRFGGHELSGADAGNLVGQFFERLFQRHGLRPIS